MLSSNVGVIHVFSREKFHPDGLVVPFETSGMVQVDRPLVLVPLVPQRSEGNLLLVPLVPLRSENPFSLSHLSHVLQLVPTCPNLSHLVVPLVLSQLSFLRFFWVSHYHSIFRKTLLNEKLASKYYDETKLKEEKINKNRSKKNAHRRQSV